LKQRIVIKNSSTKLQVFDTYLIVDNGVECVIAYKHIEALYINKRVKIGIAECLKLMESFPLFFIDRYGNILATMTKVAG